MKIAQQLIENFLYSNFTVKRSGKELHINTPFGNDKKFRLYINPEDSTWYDQKNQEGGSFDTFVSKYLDIPKKEIPLYLIKEYSGGHEELYKQEEQIIPNLEYPIGFKLFKTAKPGMIVNQALRYLINRKIPKKYIREMGYVFGDNREWNKRIIIPFFENSQVVFYLGRAFDDSFLRYNVPKGFDTKNYVFNIDEIINEEIVICEGIFDAMSIDNKVATAILSADIGIKQIQKIFDKGIKKIIMVPDKDATGEKTLIKNIEKIEYYSPPSAKPEILVFNIPEPFKDFNEYKVKSGISIIEDNQCVYINKKKILFTNLLNKIFK